MKGKEQGLSFYRTVDLPESGLTTVFVVIKRRGNGVYQVYWSREIEFYRPLSVKDEIAMDALVVEAARARLRALAKPSGAVTIA